MGRLLYTFDSPRQKRAATIYIYNNDNNQIEVCTYNAYTRIRTTDRVVIYAYTCINFGRCNSIIYTYHAVYIAGGLVKRLAAVWTIRVWTAANFQWTIGLIPERKWRRERAFDPVVRTNLRLSPVAYSVPFFLSPLWSRDSWSGSKYTSKLPGTTRDGRRWERWDWLEIASGKRRDKVSSNQMGSISRGSPPRPEVMAAESPVYTACSPLPIAVETLNVIRLHSLSW